MFRGGYYYLCLVAFGCVCVSVCVDSVYPVPPPPQDLQREDATTIATPNCDRENKDCRQGECRLQSDSNPVLEYRTILDNTGYKDTSTQYFPPFLK